jgi:hypothetical protein
LGMYSNPLKQWLCLYLIERKAKAEKLTWVILTKNRLDTQIHLKPSPSSLYHICITFTFPFKNDQIQRIQSFY